MLQASTENVQVYHERFTRPHLNDVRYIHEAFAMDSDKARSRTDSASEPAEELLGSLTTYNAIQKGESLGQTVRTSARVFKKMRQDSCQQQPTPGSAPLPDVPEKKEKADNIEKVEKENGIPLSAAISCAANSKQSASKQRMPKALWSASEKNLFFEALNEYGKDFDSITAYIFNKVKKKGVPDTITKNKHQVSHFYYRTWQKVSKHIKFGENVKKVAQELYALINYGEMRKRLVTSCVVARALPRLSELVWYGVVAVRAGGRTIRVRTPVCRALRRLNRLEEWEEQLKLPSRVAMLLCPRDMEAWSRVHAAAHNPRVLLSTASSRRLSPILALMQRRWLSQADSIRESLLSNENSKTIDSFNLLEHQVNSVLNPNTQSAINVNKLMTPLLLNTSSPILVLEDNGSANKSDESNLYVDDGAEVHILTDQKETAEEASKADESRTDKTNMWLLSEDCKDVCLHVGPKPGVDFNIPTVNVSEHLTSQRICYSVYQEKLDSGAFDSGNCGNMKVGSRFKGHKRQRKDSGDQDPNAKKTKSDIEIWDKNDHFNIFDVDETANDGMKGILREMRSDSAPRDVDDRSNDEHNFIDYRDKDMFSEQEDDEKYNNETDGECDMIIKKDSTDECKKGQKGISVNSKGKVRTRKDKEHGEISDDTGKVTNTFSTFFKKNWNRDILTQQVKKGWSVYDAGDLTIGDLYLMFGNESKLELNYWWAKPTAPFSDDAIQQIKKNVESTVNSSDTKDGEVAVNGKHHEDVKNSESDSEKVSPSIKSSIESLESDDVKKDVEISPDSKNTLSTLLDDDPNLNSFNLVSKIINNPLDGNLGSFPIDTNDSKCTSQSFTVGQRERVVTLSTRLKKLLSLSQLHMGKGRSTCSCGHVCSVSKGKKSVATNVERGAISSIKTEIPIDQMKPCIMILPKTGAQDSMGNQTVKIDNQKDVFRPPYIKTKSTPRTQLQPHPVASNKIEGLPRWTNRRGRMPKPAVVVRQLLPIAPWPQTTKTVSLVSIHPTDMIAGSNLAQLRFAQPATEQLPLDESVKTSGDEGKTIFSEGFPSIPAIKERNGQHDTNMSNSKPIKLFGSSTNINETWHPENGNKKDSIVDRGPSLSNLLDVSLPSNIGDENSLEVSEKMKGIKGDQGIKGESFSGLLHTESLSIPSLSPSRLLKENDDNWLGHDVHDFSLSSFLGHLEGTPTKSEKDSIDTPSSSAIISSQNTDESVDHLQSLMNDTSVDYMSKFTDFDELVETDCSKKLKY